MMRCVIVCPSASLKPLAEALGAALTARGLLVSIEAAAPAGSDALLIEVHADRLAVTHGGKRFDVPLPRGKGQTEVVLGGRAEDSGFAASFAVAQILKRMEGMPVPSRAAAAPAPPAAPAPAPRQAARAAAPRQAVAAARPPPADPVQQLIAQTPRPTLAARLRAAVQALARAIGRWTFAASGPGSDAVDASVFAPPAAAPGATVLVQVVAHTPGQAAEARDLATLFDEAARPRGVAALSTRIERNTTLECHLVMPGLEVEPARDHLVWNGRPATLGFAVTVPPERREGAVVGTLMVSRAGVPVGHVRFQLQVRADVKPDPRPVAAGLAAQRYRTAYVSCADEDRPLVLERIKALSRLQISVVDPGAAGDGPATVAAPAEQIRSCDLFLLFWSTRARASSRVEQELGAALAQRSSADGAGPEIVPVVLEGPPSPAPPPGLEHLKFDDYLNYLVPGGGPSAPPSGSSVLVPGTRLEDRYEIVQVLGRGGMGLVYLARDRELGDTTVALKVLPEALLAQPEAVELLRTEVRLARALTHENIVRIHDLRGQGLRYVTMEYVDGGSLADLLRARLQDRSGRPADWSGAGFSPAEVVDLVDGIASGLDHAHAERVLHRDIKPANVLLARKGARLVPKIADFGIARPMREEDGKAEQSRAVGTPAFMPPEQLRGRPLSAAADAYALAATTYALLAGRPPFTGDGILDQVLSAEPPPVPGVSPEVMSVLRLGLAKDPATRPASCMGFAQAFRAAVAQSAPCPTEDDADQATRPAPGTRSQPK